MFFDSSCNLFYLFNLAADRPVVPAFEKRFGILASGGEIDILENKEEGSGLEKGIL
jgi:hypothetical protein